MRRVVGLALFMSAAFVVACGPPTPPVPISSPQTPTPEPVTPTPEPATPNGAIDAPEGMSAIPAGAFVMGCDPDDPECDADEKPAHPVRLRAFFIDRYEVTNARYDACVAAGVCARTPMRDDPRFAGPDQPVVGVRWSDANDYCAWRGARLPTEAEWEYAARAQTRWYREAGLEAVAWYKEITDRPRDVGGKPANPWGLFDVLGNAWEWTSDSYDAAYFAASPTDDPRGPSPGETRVLRGGSWFNGSTNTRISTRHGAPPGDAANMRGARCARNGD
ncbi:MAG: SUMF1/EgtB/PvdO family nonheme iron enzyme [Deltaproteobacteria bacterium]|nr:SUMF1/EgtB/PvdO family nonheme iron enzyme [Deltaproteobacteria bacterium]